MKLSIGYLHNSYLAENTGKGQCRGLKTKMIENQEITTL